MKRDDFEEILALAAGLAKDFEESMKDPNRDEETKSTLRKRLDWLETTQKAAGVSPKISEDQRIILALLKGIVIRDSKIFELTIKLRKLKGEEEEKERLD